MPVKLAVRLVCRQPAPDAVAGSVEQILADRRPGMLKVINVRSSFTAGHRVCQNADAMPHAPELPRDEAHVREDSIGRRADRPAWRVVSDRQPGTGRLLQRHGSLESRRFLCAHEHSAQLRNCVTGTAMPRWMISSWSVAGFQLSTLIALEQSYTARCVRDSQSR